MDNIEVIYRVTLALFLAVVIIYASYCIGFAKSRAERLLAMCTMLLLNILMCLLRNMK